MKTDPKPEKGEPRRWRESSRVTIQKERFGVADLRPPLGVNTTEMDEVLPEVLRRIGLKTAYMLDALVTAWPEIVGPDNAAHCRPGQLERGRLTIYVRDSIWLMNLKRHARLFHRRVVERFPDRGIRQVWFQLDPAP